MFLHFMQGLVPEDPINPNEARSASRSDRKYDCEENLRWILPKFLDVFQVSKKSLHVVFPNSLV